MTVPTVLRKKEKKILITLNSFEDEQSNYKAGCGQMWLTGGPGPVGVGKWVVRTNSLSWDVTKIVRDGMSLDHPRRETWKSSSNLVTLSIACSLSRTCISLFTNQVRVLHVKNQLNTYLAVLVMKT